MTKSDKETVQKVNVHKGHRERVRQRFLQGGIDSLDDYQILEFLLFYVHKRKDTNPLGHELINKFKTLDGVFSATYEELCSVDGIGDSGASLITLIGQLRNRIKRSNMTRKVRLYTTEDAAEYCAQYFEDLPNERMIVISLNSKKDVIATDIISEGGPNSALVDVRKVLEIALLRKASGIILSHNHPGDSTHPSASDLVVTSNIIRVLEGINISVIDHIICNDKTYTSLAERGFLDSKPEARGD